MNIRKFKWILVFAGAIVIVLLLRGFAFTSCFIPSTGMENSIFQGERILVNKWSYGLRQPVIDRREIYIGRCIGVPGDTLFIDSLFSVISPEVQFNPDKKRLYAYPVDKENLITSLMHTLSIDDDGLMGSSDSTHVRSFSRYEHYLLEQAMNGNCWIEPIVKEDSMEILKPLIIPSKGKAVRVYPWNKTLLRNTLVLHEKKQAEIKNDTLYVEGKPVQHCHFTKDYYWVGANNAINLSDSRLFGFVPKDHIIGKASIIWFSKEKGTGPFSGYRWGRIWKRVE